MLFFWNDNIILKLHKFLCRGKINLVKFKKIALLKRFTSTISVLFCTFSFLYNTAKRKGCAFMPIYRNKQRNSWYCSFYYTDWTGKRKRKKKEGFSSRKEAREYETTFLMQRQGWRCMCSRFLHRWLQLFFTVSLSGRAVRSRRLTA